MLSSIWVSAGLVCVCATLAFAEPAPQCPTGHPIYAYVERIEQCGNRIVDIGAGTIADARADGTGQNGVHDVSAFDFETRIDVIATYEDRVFVLRPANIPWVAITSRLDADGDLVATLERIGGPCDRPPGTDWVR